MARSSPFPDVQMPSKGPLANPIPSRFRFAPACLAVASLAAGCGEVDVSGTPTTPGTTIDDGGGSDPTGLTGPTTRGFGTQVGSEGFWGCSVTARTEHAVNALVPGSEQSAEKAAGDLTGGWSLVHDLIGFGTEEGALFVDLPSTYTLVETDGDCGSYVEARVTGLLDRSERSIAVAGLMVLSADTRALRLAAPSSDGDVREAWGEPAGADLSYLRVDASLDADGTMVTGSVSHADCLTQSCAQLDELALFAGNR